MKYFRQITQLGAAIGLAVGLAVFGCGEKRLALKPQVLPFAGIDTAQVDSILALMTIEEKIGQLLVWSPDLTDSLVQNAVYQSIAQGFTGGLILKNITVEDFMYAADSCKRLAPLPLFLGTEEKVSLHGQFTGMPRFPAPASLSAIDSLGLQLYLEEKYWQECRALGINLSFQPTFKMDDRAKKNFDFQTYENETPFLLERSRRAMEEIREHRILGVGDAFGQLVFEKNDTLRDSILQRFQAPIWEGMPGLLVQDDVFKMDTLEAAQPRFLRNYFSNYLNFNGLTVVRLDDEDYLDAKIRQGANLFITPDAPRVLRLLSRRVDRGIFTQLDLNKRAREVLIAKSWVNGGRLAMEQFLASKDSAAIKARWVSLKNPEPVSIEDVISSYLPSSSNLLLRQKADTLSRYFGDPHWGFFVRSLYERSVVLAHNAEALLPFADTYNVDFQLIEYSGKPFNDFRYYFSKYADFRTKKTKVPASGELQTPELKDSDRPVVAVIVLDSINLQPGFHREFIAAMNEMGKATKTVVVNFGNPKNLTWFDPAVSAVQVFERNEFTEIYAAQLLFGGVSPEGRMPLETAEHLPFGAAAHPARVRLGYAIPEETGIMKERLVGINAIAESAIDKKVFPGCQVVVAKDGEVIFSQAFGTKTYGGTDVVQKTDLYDIASLTKVAATTLAVMKLREEKKLALKGTVNEYLPLDDQATVGKVEIDELLLHQSGLQAQMPIARYLSWRNVPKAGCNDYFCRKQTDNYDIEMVDKLFFRNDYPDTIWKKVYHLPVAITKRYHYSDVNFFLLQKIVETLSGSSLDKYVFENFYRPMGLRRITYLPLRRFSKSEIVPTENDRIWRKGVVQGNVHDPSAALMGGVGGSAGVFADGEDLAAVFQMLVNGGSYGGRQYLDPEMVKEFTEGSKINHRGLGFDKPVNRRYPTYSRNTSPKSFGHTGFTGTCAWADPENKIVYIFLSNRVYPNSNNGKIFSEAVRSRIHEVVYDALGSFKMDLPEISEELLEGEGAGN